jgi:hypothetical protein
MQGLRSVRCAAHSQRVQCLRGHSPCTAARRLRARNVRVLAGLAVLRVHSPCTALQGRSVPCAPARAPPPPHTHTHTCPHAREHTQTHTRALQQPRRPPGNVPPLHSAICPRVLEGTSSTSIPTPRMSGRGETTRRATSTPATPSAGVDAAHQQGGPIGAGRCCIIMGCCCCCCSCCCCC